MEFTPCTPEQLLALLETNTINDKAEAPTQEHARKLLRDRKQMHVTPEQSYNDNGLIYMVFFSHFKPGEVTSNTLKDFTQGNDEYRPPMVFKNYEDALNAGLNDALGYLQNGEKPVTPTTLKAV